MIELLDLATERSLLLLGLVLFLLLFAAKEAGYYAARRWHAQRGVDETARTSVGFITGGMLALLAFLLAISLSIADRRYEDRRAVVLAQANAIGTAWLRAGAQDTEAGRTLQRLLKDYAEVRIQAAGPIETPAPVLERTAALQSEIWTIAGTIARAAPTAVSAQLLASLNEVFDLAVSERQAFRSLVPRHLLRLLLWASLLAIAGLGFHLGMQGSWQFAMSTLLILMWTSSMVLIVDINRSGQGFIEVSADPLIWTLEPDAVAGKMIALDTGSSRTGKPRSSHSGGGAGPDTELASHSRNFRKIRPRTKSPIQCRCARCDASMVTFAPEIRSFCGRNRTVLWPKSALRSPPGRKTSSPQRLTRTAHPGA